MIAHTYFRQTLLKRPGAGLTASVRDMLLTATAVWFYSTTQQNAIVVHCLNLRVSCTIPALHELGSALAQVRAGQLATAEGVSYLEAKNLLLLSYCTHIVFYLLLKAEGRPVRTHPVIGRLLQIRAYLVRRCLADFASGLCLRGGLVAATRLLLLMSCCITARGRGT